MASHGEDINDIIDNILQIIWSRLKRNAEELKNKEEIKKELNMDEKTEKDFIKDVKRQIKDNTPENNLNNYKDLERKIQLFDLKKRSGFNHSRRDISENKLDILEKDIYVKHLKQPLIEQLKTQYNILQSIDEKNINSDILSQKIKEVDDSIKNIERQNQTLSSDLASQIMSEISQNKEMMGSFSSSIKEQAMNNISLLNQNSINLKSPVMSASKKTNIKADIQHVSKQTDSIQSKEAQNEKTLPKEIEIEHEIER
ncbi:hypothetical protein [Bacillus safensis]|uniref:Uncharacterized protein n=1 Tax=Bacillus safensis TaxID=561879 RepID=A0A1L6ZPD1_BACIA|nr:hypothetical protein [Bacillus safensis]APT48381.1 hypothetical protein BSA145_21195 [Bacillus safensis]